MGNGELGEAEEHGIFKRIASVSGWCGSLAIQWLEWSTRCISSYLPCCPERVVYKSHCRVVLDCAVHLVVCVLEALSHWAQIYFVHHDVHCLQGKSRRRQVLPVEPKNGASSFLTNVQRHF